MKSIKSCLGYLLNPQYNRANYRFSSSKLNSKINSFHDAPLSILKSAISDIKVLFSPHLLGGEYVMLNIIK